jgi:hypothetical protein
MISRIWRGWTTLENSERYEKLLRTEVLPGIAGRGISGYLGAHLLRRNHPDEVEFVTILWFESLESVRGFMGDDYETAYVPPQARAVLARWDERSSHYDVLLEP